MGSTKRAIRKAEENLAKGYRRSAMHHLTQSDNPLLKFYARNIGRYASCTTLLLLGTLGCAGTACATIYGPELMRYAQSLF
ncbi:MAG: hypothetical protein J4428_04945 [Candidatus Aenigmarchaeota archaeon]|nr:hypothetical protein [Candidatus Aenigmarchaeota archaeon]